MQYIPIHCKTAIQKNKNSRTPYEYEINIYRGCEHGCIYCYALYSHHYLNDEQFFDHIYYKENIVEVLRKELSSPRWSGGIINLGSVSDCYQPCERELCLTREILKLMIEFKQSINISTKSKLILRDLDLLSELSKVAQVNITCTITTADEHIQKLIEPLATSSLERMKVLQILKQQTHASVGILMMPIIPYLTDFYENLEAIYQLAQNIQIDFIIPGILYLRGPTKTHFYNIIQSYHDSLYRELKQLYISGSCTKEYRKQVYQKITELQKKYPLSF